MGVPLMRSRATQRRTVSAARSACTELHVWLTDDGPTAERRPEWLDERERERWTRLCRAADRDLFLVAHTHLRATLARYTGRDPQQLRFAREGNGQPTLVAHDAGAPELRLSLAHVPGLVACAVTEGAACGVDVERAGRVSDPASVARAVLHARESAAVAADPEVFLTVWTLKEAYAKAIGEGLAAELKSFWIDVGDGSEPRVRRASGGALPGWQLWHDRPAADHHLATAVSPSRPTTVIWA